MARGRKADPKALQEAKGNPGRRARAEDPPAVETKPARMTAPARLKGDAAAIYERLAPQLARMKFLSATDVDAFERYCATMARWWQLTKTLKTSGETYWTESAHGKMRRLDPRFIVRERLERNLLALEDRFGLSPRARQEITRAMAAAPPVGSLFDGAAEAQDAGAPAPAEATPASAIGLLSHGSDRVH